MDLEKKYYNLLKPSCDQNPLNFHVIYIKFVQFHNTKRMIDEKFYQSNLEVADFYYYILNFLYFVYKLD